MGKFKEIIKFKLRLTLCVFVLNFLLAEYLLLEYVYMCYYSFTLFSQSLAWIFYLV